MASGHFTQFNDVDTHRSRILVRRESEKPALGLMREARDLLEKQNVASHTNGADEPEDEDDETDDRQDGVGEGSSNAADDPDDFHAPRYIARQKAPVKTLAPPKKA